MSRMSLFVLVVLAIGPLATSASAGEPCADAETQLEMNTCAAEFAKVAEAGLQEVYSKATVELDAALVEKLQTTQEAWRAYRDGQCVFEAALYEGGSMQPMILALCKTRMADQRADELRASQVAP